MPRETERDKEGQRETRKDKERQGGTKSDKEGKVASMQTGVSREELVMEQVKFGSSGKKLKILWAVVVLLLVMTILFIGLFATERKKANDAEERAAIANKQKGTVITTKKPVVPTTPVPGTLITPDSVQVAASEYLHTSLLFLSFLAEY